MNEEGNQKIGARINIVGTSGSGKSTLAKELASFLGYPYIEMDRIFWGPNWTSSSDEEFSANLKSSLQGSHWILDGNYNRSIPVKWQNVETVVWLDYSFTTTLFQAVRRAVRRAWTKEELWPETGNRESFQKSFFTKDSIIWWTITTHGSVRKKYENYMCDARFAHIQFVRLRNRKETRQFIDAHRPFASFLKSGIPERGLK